MRAWLAALWALLVNWHESRPPATTFAEGQQALMVKMLARCGIAATLIIISISGLLAYLILTGAAEWLQRLAVYGLLGVIALYGLTNIAIVLSYAVGGPVGRIDLEATRNGVKAGASKDTD